MRRLRIVIPAVAASIALLLAGTALGYYVVPDSQGVSAQCIILSNDLEELTYRGPGSGDARAGRIVDMYNEHCR